MRFEGRTPGGFNYTGLTWWNGFRAKLWPLFAWWWPGIVILWTDQTSEEEARQGYYDGEPESTQNDTDFF